MPFEEKSFRSFNEKDTIQAWIYKPIHKPRGIVQIVHGFREHSRRYLHMILKLNEAGFVVAADRSCGTLKPPLNPETGVIGETKAT